MNIFSYPVTITYDELKTECGIDLATEVGKEKERSFMNGVNRAIYDGGVYLTGASDLKDRIIKANPDCATAIKRALLVQAQYMLDAGDVGTESGITITADGQKAVVSRSELRSKTICPAAVDALKACPVPILYAGEVV
jgi:hypothetical protein